MNEFRKHWFDRANNTNNKIKQAKNIRKYYIFVTIQIFMKIFDYLRYNGYTLKKKEIIYG
ncbi:hypothetical protein B7726_06180 [Streptococcus oralis subsp. tigurinus]|nr:hypothetical protein B7726_06180 [Streptococcus oralis subsp. tigurinus]